VKLFLKELIGWRLLVAFIVTTGLVAAFYAIENTSGKNNWEKCKKELEAKGMVLDWAAFIPEPVPEEQNVFAAPNMQAWFVGPGYSALSARLSPAFSAQGKGLMRPLVLADITVIPREGSASTSNADLVLDYSGANVRLVTATNVGSTIPTNAPIVPLIVMDAVPLADALQHLAHAAGMACKVDPGLLVDANGAQPTVTIRWENITARNALEAVAANYGLRLVEERERGRWHFAHEDSLKPKIDQLAQRELRQRLAQVVVPYSELQTNSGLKASQGFRLVLGSSSEISPIQVCIYSDVHLTCKELREFFPQHAVSKAMLERGRLEVEATGTNRFVLKLSSPPSYSVKEYLAWSDNFGPEFESLRQGLKRPYARMSGDYSSPVSMPIQNFVAVRLVAQMLAQRAQCYLLLGDGKRALDELTLFHDLSRILEAKPSGRPMTLVSAMIDVAVCGVYVSTVADGLRLHVWRESELAQLQRQLAEIKLGVQVQEAFREEAARMCRTLDTSNPAQLRALGMAGGTPTLAQKLKDPKYWLFSQTPRGWIYENMVTAAKIEQKLVEGFDVQRDLIFPDKLDASAKDLDKTFSRFSPSTFIAAMFIPNCTRACRIMAQNQTLVNEGLVACGLERFRLSRGQIPTALADLSPEFVDKLPHDLIGGASLHYLPKENGRYLLYSVGWNGSDEGGKIVVTQNGAPDLEKGDWVWQTNEKEL